MTSGGYFGSPDQEVVERLPLNEVIWDDLGPFCRLCGVSRCTSAAWRSLARFYLRYQVLGTMHTKRYFTATFSIEFPHVTSVWKQSDDRNQTMHCNTDRDSYICIPSPPRFLTVVASAYCAPDYTFRDLRLRWPSPAAGCWLSLWWCLLLLLRTRWIPLIRLLMRIMTFLHMLIN